MPRAAPGQPYDVEARIAELVDEARYHEGQARSLRARIKSLRGTYPAHPPKS